MRINDQGEIVSVADPSEIRGLCLCLGCGEN